MNEQHEAAGIPSRTGRVDGEPLYHRIVRSAVCVAAIVCAASASAQFIIQPTIVSNTMGEQPGLEAIHLVDQSGLSAPYASGITNFDTYAASVTHPGAGSWNSAPFVSSGTMVFDLGAIHEVSAMALWQGSNFFSQAIATMSLRGDIDGDFSSGAVTMGSFFNIPAAAPGATVLVFLPVTARYVECTFTNYGNGFGTIANEIAFRVDGPQTWTDLGQGKAGSAGIPWLIADGFLNIGSLNHLQLSRAQSFASATLVIGLAELNAPFKGGVMVPDPLLLPAWSTDGVGTAQFSFVLPAGVPPGTELVFQAWIQDFTASFHLSASNGLRGITS
jgi:hypothetical protein